MDAHSVRVAILDDDPSVRTALVRLLKTAGMAVDAYGTGDELLASLAIKLPDCLVLDFQMPGMNGLEVLQDLGRRQVHVPTIVITAHNTTGVRSACLDAGALAYLNKPLDPEQLIQIIHEVSEASRSGAFTSSA